CESTIDHAPTKDLWRVDLVTLTELVWNTQVQAKGRDAANVMAWNDFKALLTTEFCPSNGIENLEGEFWNHSMVGADHTGYTDRFHELAKLVPYLVTPEVKPAILTAGILTDEAVRSGTLAKAGEKRKERDTYL
ncbi:reverse transcriptase domain-containing protein, partial [Tanacetum coccineum]